MGRFPLRRLLASAMLFVVGVGGGGMPTLDALVFHGPTRRAESFRSHYEASGSCHADGCSIRSDVQPGTMGDRSPQAPLVVAVALVAAAPFRESVVGVSVSLRYLSRAPPRTA